MSPQYEETLRKATALFIETLIREHGPELVRDPSGLDEVVRQLVRELGRRTVQGSFERLVEQLLAQVREVGMTPQRSASIVVATVFGRVRVPSPYLWNRTARRGIRPVAEHWKLYHGARSRAVERALTDFGAEESFGQASKRFEEHYGFDVDRTMLLRVVESHAQRAEAYLEQHWAQHRAGFDEPLATRPGVARVLVQIDDSEIRTGVLVPSPSPGRTAVRGLPKRVRQEAWRDVRLGLARTPEEVTPSYVARLDSYPAVVGQLFSAACKHGLSSRTAVTAIADGGNGILEELQAQFPDCRFVLDRPHAKHHLYETAEAMGLHAEARETWVQRQTTRLDEGNVRPLLDELRWHKGRGKKRVNQLRAHFTRFQDSFAYDAIRAQGLPIASGEVEAAHRVIPQKRMKLPGAWWHPDHVNPMLALRVLRANGLWNAFWKQAA